MSNMDSSETPHQNVLLLPAMSNNIDEHLFLHLLSPPPPPKDTPHLFTSQSSHMLPTQTIIKLGAQNFISPSSHHPLLLHPSPTLVLPNSEQDSKAIHLIHNLLYSANMVAEDQYELALNFLKACDAMSSPTGTPIQRLVFYFSQALFKKVAHETGRIIPTDSDHADPLEMVMIPNMPLQIAFYKEYPLGRILKLVGVQAILEHLQGATKVHIIDLVIRSGVHWIILMQALASRNQLLKISVVAQPKWKSKMEEVGTHLASYAHSLHLNFSFKIVLVDDILDLNPNMFDRVADESVSIYASHALMSMVGQVDKLDHLMTVMRSLSPCVIIVTELEVNCNSPNFVGRFVESLFFFGAIFDSLADCFKDDESNRVNAESTWFRTCIKNVLATEGEERKIRHVNINVWRAFFGRHGLVETDLSTSISPLDQATLGLQSLECWKSCTLCMDGKCLIIGWKGTPLASVSAWKFQSHY